jgi:hypothetical protein
MRSRICAVVLALGLLSTMAEAQSGGSRIGPSGGEVAGIVVGVAVGIAVVIYLVVPKEKKIEGCVAPSDHGLQLTSEGNHESYALTGESANLQAGTRVKLKGKLLKKHAGVREFEVRQVLRQEGACKASAPTS